MFHVSKLSPWFWMKPILRRGHRNTSCRISNRTREGITPFPSETSTFVWTNWLLLRTSSTIRSQVTGDWSFKKTADGRTNHASVPSPASERMQREKKREWSHRQIGRRSIDPCWSHGNSIYPSLAHEQIRFLSDDLYFSLWSAIIGHACSLRMKWNNLR